MDLHVRITDESGNELGYANIYQDGSDSDGTEEILRFIDEYYQIEEREKQISEDLKATINKANGNVTLCDGLYDESVVLNIEELESLFSVIRKQLPVKL